VGTRDLAIPAELLQLAAGAEVKTVAAEQRWVVEVMRSAGPACIRLLWRMLGDEHMVVDAYQESLCQLLRLGENGRPRHAAGYFYRCAVNAALEQLRRRERQRAALERWAQARRNEVGATIGSDRGIAEPIEPERVAVLRRAILSLPAHLRDAVVLHDLAELSYKETAQILGISPETCRVYRRRAIVRLAEQLQVGGGA